MFEVQRPLAAILYLFLAVICTGCTSIGPKVLPSNRHDFNSALQLSDRQQLLLNLVRLKFIDDPYFLGVATVNVNLNFSAGVNGSYNYTGTPGIPPTSSVNIAPSLNYSDSPTITYVPLQGEEFTRQFLTPISLENLMLLYQSGWNIERILRLSIQALGEVQNAPSAARPSSDEIPKFKEFIEITHLLRELGVHDIIDSKAGLFEDKPSLEIIVKPRYTNNADVRKLKRLLGVSPEFNNFWIVQHPTQAPNAFLLQTRSVLGMMHYLSKGVVMTEKQVKSNIVLTPRYKDGRYFNWDEVLNGMMKICISNSEPLDAAVAVVYRNRWYYIAETDYNSKETFSLITLIFSLAAGNVKGQQPVLTLQV